jgi:hypothetical protein
MMDCRTARLLLEFTGSRRSEIEPSELESLEDHLADCPQCRGYAESERALDEHIARAMRAVPLPEGLRGRLLDHLNAERRRSYRRQALVYAGGLSVAASLIVVALLWWNRPSHREGVNLETAWNANFWQNGSPPERVQEWFQERYHRQTVPPVGFNYNSLKFYDLVEFEGKRVPLLFFVRDGANARVYILSAKDFDFDNVIEAPGYNINLIHHPTDNRFAYVAIYSSERLDWFLDKNSETQLGMNAVPESGAGGQ